MLLIASAIWSSIDGTLTSKSAGILELDGSSISLFFSSSSPNGALDNLFLSNFNTSNLSKLANMFSDSFADFFAY